MPNPKVPVPKGADVAATNYNKYYQTNNVSYGNQLRWVSDPGRSDPSKGKFMRLADWERMMKDKENRPGAYAALANPSLNKPAVATPSVPIAGAPAVVTYDPNRPPVAPAEGTPGGPIPFFPAPSVPGTSGNPPIVGAGAQPNWWIGQAYANPNEQQAFANAANSLLPSLSPEDQRTMATYLATNFKDVFGSYANAQFAPIPTNAAALRNQYLDPNRAQNALAILDKMQAATPGAKLGTGYDYLKNAVALMTKYTTPGTPMTREQYAQFAAALKSLNASMGSDVSAYKNLATMFNLPGFSSGQLVSNDANKQLNY